MAEEPDNMVLVMLREIRAKQEEHSQMLGAHTQQFERLEKRFDDVHGGMLTALGLASHAHVRDG